MSECGAKTRSGKPCKNKGMNNGRCRFHGGMSTGPKEQRGNTKATAYGIYSRRITEEERGIWEDIPIGTLDDELKIARLQLRRALIAQRDEQ